ncbi:MULTISPECIES: hypothetical protein [unclassified Sphingomonas]|uniref:hypothetical protein n=1 Tax=Sphingomonas TaxID=13687 RepID=UPI00095DA231|nr:MULTISPECIES: hypothetical protein [unclassified Sphingomonas]MBN8813022.1 hypothetical protein [Sphingomonas sp.]OJY54246.1 MAG: hypothetical protein BGP17_03855 [Sphingomonas sp. 67-41]
MRGFGIKTRIVLVGAIVLILLGYGWWFLAAGKVAAPDTEFEITNFSAELTPGREAAELAKLPMFDPATGGWIADGRRQASAAGLVRPQPGPRGPDDIGPYLTARLPDGAGKREMQIAMRALAREGICQVAFLVPGAEAVPVIRIRRVADGRGGTIACTAARNSAAR